MKILVTADIHANLEALNAVLDSVKEQYDGFISLGDMVGYGPDPEACIQRLKELKKRIRPCILLAGNHEAGLLKRLPNSWFGKNARLSLKNTAPLISWILLGRSAPSLFFIRKDAACTWVSAGTCYRISTRRTRNSYITPIFICRRL